jgi:hypothetical protein
MPVAKKPVVMRLDLGSFLLLASILVPACASSVEQSADFVPVCEQLLQARTANGQRCFGIFAVAPSAAERRAFVDSCAGIAAAPGSRLTHADVSACTAALDTCVPGWGYPSCLGAGTGLIYPGHDRKGSRAPGEECFAGVQCDSGYCSAGDGACGACQRVRHSGETCTDDDDRCVDAFCLEGTCGNKEPKAGDPCVGFSADECGDTLYCKLPSPAHGTCVSRAGVGEACDAAPCLPALFCKAGTCMTPRPDGASCEGPDDCVSRRCKDGVCWTAPWGIQEGMDCSEGVCRQDLMCGDDLVCAPRVYAQAGVECMPVDPPLDGCAPGFYCHFPCWGSDNCPGPPKGNCRALPGPGEPCGVFSECAVGMTCEGNAAGEGIFGTCTRMGGEGDPCPCFDALVCVDGTCKPAGAALCE